MGSRVWSEKPLAAKGFLESKVVGALKKTWAKDPRQVKICELLLKNWMAPQPASAQQFLIEHRRLRQEYQSIPSVCYQNENGRFRITNHGLVFMTAIGVTGARTIASQWNRVYGEIRKTYVKPVSDQYLNPKNIAMRLKLDLKTVLRAIDAIEKLGMVQVTAYALVDQNKSVAIEKGNEILSPTERILDHADIWSIFEMMAGTLPGAGEFIPDSSIIRPLALSYSVDLHILAICPTAREYAEKALERMMPDPAGAITAARSLVETVVKWVAHEVGISDAIANTTTNKAFKACFSAMGGGEFDKPGITEVILGMQGALNGLDSARNSMADSHGPGPVAHTASTRISVLLVGLAINTTVFLLQSYDSIRKP